MMNKEDERITYEEFMTMFKFAPRLCYTLYDRAENEIENLQKKIEQLKKERASIMTSLTISRQKYNNDKARYRRKYKNLKKQKDDVVEYLKHYINFRKDIYPYIDMREFDLDKLLRMLGEIDVED